jgi:hypothetical protein
MDTPFATLIAVGGVSLLLSGDLTGIASLAFAALAGLAVLATNLMIQRLSKMDEYWIRAALRAISEET